MFHILVTGLVYFQKKKVYLLKTSLTLPAILYWCINWVYNGKIIRSKHKKLNSPFVKL
jgi:hypothetical protein